MIPKNPMIAISAILTASPDMPKNIIWRDCGGVGVGNQFLVLKQLNLFSKTFLQSVFV